MYAQQFVGGDGQLFMQILKIALIVIAILVIVIGVIYIQMAVRKIAIQYSKGTGRAQMSASQATHLPLKVNPAGVIPVIFAVSFIITPQTIASFF